ncbi:hypothetical protein AMATHDRAFT_142006 [Amanita thiersii Skay4041]|uniref:triacylglycerol lipase n=1 Tax=Amanita thiersii Skay4041 TaxID=703135 RepID=A0A2A9NVN3_9AGAR|nr:hypothetical protein AMATHDRAFT_142006 [Amanita thiersii Skay4041]
MPSSPLLIALFINLIYTALAASPRQIIFNSYQQIQPDSVQQHPLISPGSPPSFPNAIHSTPTRPITIKATPTTVYRPRSLDALHNARMLSLRHAQSEPVEWEQIQVFGPDVQDKHTLIQLARMAGNAYALPGHTNWYDLDPAWNAVSSFPFGWDGPDGFRGHVFLSSDNSTVILSIKGTTLQGPTSRKDKFNDNLLFSCCCARVDITWIFNTVCDCYAHSQKCDNTCLSNALIEDSLFYSIGVRLVDDLRHLYPLANIWLVGHSLGGALASLLGATYGLPAVAFESPGERLAAQRLHLPLPPPQVPPNITNTNTPPLPPVAVTHIYHTGDPIPQGTCTGFGSPCAQAGYAMETHCHLGKTIVFDTVEKLGWRVDVRRHVIRDVIHKVLEIEDIEWEEGREVPMAREEVNCTECRKWQFGDFKDPDDGDSGDGGDNDDDDDDDGVII